jgi:Cu(I)/Ag(I) efflux system membrane protein CusA/SilA
VGYVKCVGSAVRARVMMQSTGLQTPVGIKVTGPDVTVIEEVSRQIEGLLRGFEGTKSVIAERIAEGYYVDVRNDLPRMGERSVTVVRYGIGGANIVGVKQADRTITPMSVQYY